MGGRAFRKAERPRRPTLGLSTGCAGEWVAELQEYTGALRPLVVALRA